MRQLLFISIGCLFSMQVLAFGATTNFFNSLATSGTSAGSSGSSAATDTSKRDKIIAQAQSDAITFVASQGQIKGVYLETALAHLRQYYPATQEISDLELANAMIVFEKQ